MFFWRCDSSCLRNLVSSVALWRVCGVSLAWRLSPTWRVSYRIRGAMKCVRVVGRWCDCLFYENGSKTVRKGPCFSGGVIHRVCETWCPPWRCGVSEVVLQASHTIGIKWPKNSWATMLRGRICVYPIGMPRNRHKKSAMQHVDAAYLASCCSSTSVKG